MWCKNCRQDVPAVSGGADEKPCCIRCGSVILERQATLAKGRGAVHAPDRSAASAAAPAAIAKTRGHATSAGVPRPIGAGIAATAQSAGAIVQADGPTISLRAPLSTFDTWEIEEQLRHVDRILSGARFTTELKHAPAAAHSPAPSAPMKTKLAASAASRERPRRARLRARVAWIVVATGAAALASGVVLLAVGTIAGWAIWQNFGLPLTLLGQVALLLGMMLQLDLVWHGKRETASKLYSFQKRLLDLEALAAELSPSTDEDSSPASNERELMVELKTRLDLLSHRLNVPCG